ncbi:protein of unknown function [Ralstonia solanacearum CFBP2957]|nr:protein of unknown function [Ralstonia solanacearum CFBP2957]
MVGPSIKMAGQMVPNRARPRQKKRRAGVLFDSKLRPTRGFYGKSTNNSNQPCPRSGPRGAPSCHDRPCPAHPAVPPCLNAPRKPSPAA